MQELPHQYIATATAGAAGALSAQVEDVVELGMAAPATTEPTGGDAPWDRPPPGQRP